MHTPTDDQTEAKSHHEPVIKANPWRVEANGEIVWQIEDGGLIVGADKRVGERLGRGNVFADRNGGPKMNEERFFWWTAYSHTPHDRRWGWTQENSWDACCHAALSKLIELRSVELGLLSDQEHRVLAAKNALEHAMKGGDLPPTIQCVFAEALMGANSFFERAHSESPTLRKAS